MISQYIFIITKHNTKINKTKLRLITKQNNCKSTWTIKNHRHTRLVPWINCSSFVIKEFMRLQYSALCPWVMVLSAVLNQLNFVRCPWTLYAWVLYQRCSAFVSSNLECGCYLQLFYNVCKPQSLKVESDLNDLSRKWCKILGTRHYFFEQHVSIADKTTHTKLSFKRLNLNTTLNLIFLVLLKQHVCKHATNVEIFNKPMTSCTLSCGMPCLVDSFEDLPPREWVARYSSV